MKVAAAVAVAVVAAAAVVAVLLFASVVTPALLSTGLAVVAVVVLPSRMEGPTSATPTVGRTWGGRYSCRAPWPPAHVGEEEGEEEEHGPAFAPSCPFPLLLLLLLSPAVVVAAAAGEVRSNSGDDCPPVTLLLLLLERLTAEVVEVEVEVEGEGEGEAASRTGGEAEGCCCGCSEALLGTASLQPRIEKRSGPGAAAAAVRGDDVLTGVDGGLPRRGATVVAVVVVVVSVVAAAALPELLLLLPCIPRVCASV